MKRKHIALTIALAGVLALTPSLAACSGDHYSKVSFPAQDTSYAVTSQGGSAVAYGNYIYFINGTRGYDDTDGKANVWGEVVKGGLYRAELNGEKADGAPASFTVRADGEGIELKYTEDTDYFGNPEKVADVAAIAPKTIGTSGYSRGGLFIYDDYVYFASPNNTKSKTGVVQTTRTDFFMMPLSGGAPTKLYTTGEGVDTSSAAYAFYKYGGSVYLVTHEGGSIFSIKINHKKSKAEDPVEYKVNASSVYFPVRDEYYDGIDTNTVEDFIYFVRDVADNSGEQKSGAVIEAMRPDGSEGMMFYMDGKSPTIECVRDGVLYYRVTDTVGNTVLAYDSLHDALMEKSASYRDAQNAIIAANAEKPADEKQYENRQISGQFHTVLSSSMTIYPIRPDTQSNEVYFIADGGSSLNKYSTDGTVTRLAAATGTPLFVRGNYLYYSDGNGGYYRTPVYENIEGFGIPTELATDTTSATLGSDYAAGYFTYFGKVDDWADAYTYFYKVDGLEGVEPQFVGKRADADIPTQEQIDEALGITDDEEE